MLPAGRTSVACVTCRTRHWQETFANGAKEVIKWWWLYLVKHIVHTLVYTVEPFAYLVGVLKRSKPYLLDERTRRAATTTLAPTEVGGGALLTPDRTAYGPEGVLYPTHTVHCSRPPFSHLRKAQRQSSTASPRRTEYCGSDCGG